MSFSENSTLLEKDPMRRMLLGKRREGGVSILVGVLGALLLHLLGWWWIPQDMFRSEPSEVKNRFRDFSIVLEDPVEEEEFVYTQTNPDVPDNEPDETNRISARNQQAANPEEVEELDPDALPASESERNIETQQFLSGELEPELAAPPPTGERQEDNQEQTESSQPAPLLQLTKRSEGALKKEIPIQGTREEELGDEGILDFLEREETPTNVTDFLEGEAMEGEEGKNDTPEELAEDSPMSAPSPALVTSADGVPSPRARPKLPRVPSGPVRNSTAGVAATGQLAADAKASKFGEYMERVIEAVKINWDNLANRSSHKERNSMVRVRFVIDRYGYVSDMEILEGTTSKAIGIYMCREAIERGAPYGDWPAELIELFGDDEDLTFQFFYQ
ncbi:hypothetical protein [Pelagicoccus sp. SDUM812003]|uniref:hypothetical protein n=1 Tax=Pelagicoccus sp. SDUM812003 TaxID=3041267 RepID=UPI00280F01C1|nr:hypothetical protein [Pelagicoccus sp. SDUM812003]MDQ8203159.1 hypothetical protein [Pelagicoccus sp. SDUM812003]